MADAPTCVHPTAIVSKTAELSPGVNIGPGCVIDGPVKLGPNVSLIGNVYITGPAEIGADTTLYPFVCIGFPGQDFKFKPGMETAGVRIGQSCIIREHSTIHAATKTARPTTVGDRVMMMVNTHVAHDAALGSNVVMVNNSSLGGHAQVADNATLSACVSIHQFVRVGRYVFFSGGTAVSADVPPFCTVSNRQILGGINRVGLRRAGFSREDITRVHDAFRLALRGGLTREDMLRTLRELGESCDAVREMADFVAASTRAICVARRSHSGVVAPGTEGGME